MEHCNWLCLSGPDVCQPGGVCLACPASTQAEEELVNTLLTRAALHVHIIVEPQVCVKSCLQPRHPIVVA